MYRWQITERITREKLMAVIRTQSPAEALEIARAAAAGGIGVLEVTMTVPGALDCIRDLAGSPESMSGEWLVGVGTVLDAETARLAILAGARFVVCPVLARDIIEMCHRYGVPVIPGVSSPTEIKTALEWGADLIKVFPADTVGTSYFKSVRAAIPQAPLVPSGGVSLQTAAAWLEAGAVALGLGGSLTAPPTREIPERARQLRQVVDAARAGSQ